MGHMPVWHCGLWRASLAALHCNLSQAWCMDTLRVCPSDGEGAFLGLWDPQSQITLWYCAAAFESNRSKLDSNLATFRRRVLGMGLSP